MTVFKNKICRLVRSAFAESTTYDQLQKISNKLLAFGPQIVPDIVHALKNLERWGILKTNAYAMNEILEVIQHLCLPEHFYCVARLVKLDSLYSYEDRGPRCKILDIFVKIGDKKLIPYLAEFRRRVRRIYYVKRPERRRGWCDSFYESRDFYEEAYGENTYLNRMDNHDIRQAIEKILKKSGKRPSQVPRLIRKMFEDRDTDLSQARHEIQLLASPEDIDFAVAELCRRVKPEEKPSRQKYDSAVFYLICAILPKAQTRHAAGICEVLASDLVSLDGDASTRGRIIGWVKKRVRDRSVLPWLAQYRNKMKTSNRKQDLLAAREAIKEVQLPPGEVDFTKPYRD